MFKIITRIPQAVAGLLKQYFQDSAIKKEATLSE
jgi:hypothetical protein